tara:strand:- start:2290 stop:2448 length:159 start_codon:yes stop_codon:yes gene_type:complete
MNRGDELYIDGFTDGFHGRKVASDDPEYINAYSRGYHTSESQAEIKEYWNEQ